jgi:uncharacterized protein (TIGR02996 family)
MRTFTHTDEKSSKFWGIERQGKALTVSSGAVGGQAETSTRKLRSEADARLEHNKLIRKKRREGYVETRPRPAPLGPVGEALEKALVEGPDDLAAHMAYADWLSEQDEPSLAARGELIQVQLALEGEGQSDRGRTELRRRERALLDEHQRAWLGGLAPFLVDRGTDDLPQWMWRHADDRGAFAFRRGWLDVLHVGQLTEELAGVLARSPEVRLLRDLAVQGLSHHSAPAAFALLGQSPYLGNLRRLDVGGYGYGVERLVRGLPRVESIAVTAAYNSGGRLFRLRNLGHLRSLHVEQALHYPLRDLAANPSLGHLTHLMLCPGLPEERDAGAFITLEGLRALLRSKHLPALTHLTLSASDFGDEGCRELVASGMLKRLEALDLALGRITDEGARALADCPDLRHLQALDVSGNRLTRAGVRALRATGVKVAASGQQGPDGDDE